MEPNNNKKKIIIALCCAVAVILLTIPFLGKDNQTPKKISNQSNKKEIFNNFNESKSTNKVSKKKIVFVIFGIVVVILIISLIILFIKRNTTDDNNNNKNKIDNTNNNKALEAFLSQRCFGYNLCNPKIQIIFGNNLQEPIYISEIMLFFKDINSKAKQQFKFYQILANDQSLKDSLITFYKLTIDFFFEIDGYLLKAYYDQNNNNNTPLGQMSKNFNENTLIDQERIKILEFDKTDATRDLSDEEKQLLLNNDYVNLFKTIMQNKNLPYYVEQNIIQKQQLLNNHGSILNEKLPIFEHCHAIYMKIKDIYSELTTFFSKPENEEHSNKYKAKIDNAMKAINNFLEIQQENNQPPT